MNRIRGKLALVTGASAGIGEATARALASHGADLVLCARRAERLEALATELGSEYGVAVHVRALDVRDSGAVTAFGQDLVDRGLVPDVLVNNAGLARDLTKTQDGRFESWDQMIDTNVKGLLYVTRAILPHMIERDSGHVVNIGSISGREVYPGGNVYNATKFAVFGLNRAMNVDLAGTAVRMSSVDPGAVETEFSEVRFYGDTERAEKVYQGYQPLLPEDVADAICYVVNTPEHVNILELLILPTAQRNTFVFHKEG
jgi:NADP-dependent 3-hydroxy acid dehydrogenase YdfG